ncbi:hypothetical protein HY411_02195 [Candidatus Gottesmanbacteria bacterium]|nr:hypothetical protein [Candidatus Gottesmanbacteria bacterium]
MRKLLKPGDVLVLGLAGALDVFEEVKDPFGIMAQGCKALYGWVPSRYRRHNFSRLLGRQLKTGDIEKVVKGDDVYLRLTSTGKERIVRDFPLFSLANKPWDKRWRVVIFDIAEINRNTREALRDKLRELGFGMLQESVWITPHDVSLDMREFLEHYELDDAAFVLEVSAVLAGDQERLVRKVWNLDNLEEAYRTVINEVKQFQDMYIASDGRRLQHTDKRHRKGENMEDEVRNIRQRYIEALIADPCLPKELWPDGWPAEESRHAVKWLQRVMPSREKP